MDYKPLFINFGKMLIAGGLTFGICYASTNLFNEIPLPKYIFETVKILVIMLICATSYIGLNLVLEMNYAPELIARIKK
jgi:hypothetical protein